MTFNVQKAREICSIRAHVAETRCYDAKADREAADMLPAALDEIVRLRRECRECINANTYAQAKRIAELEEALVDERANLIGVTNATAGKLIDCLEADKFAREQLRAEGKI